MSEEIKKLQEENRLLKKELEETRLELKKSQTLADVFNHADIGICITDEKGYFVELNKSYERIYGYSYDELIGKHFTEIVDDGQKEYAAKLHDDFIGGNAELPTQWKVKRKDGEHIHIFATAGLLVDKDSKRFKITTVSDVTKQKKANDDVLRMSKIIERELAEVYVFEEGTLRIIDCNESVVKNLGYSKSEIQELTPVDIKPGISQQQFLELISPLSSGKSELIAFESIHQRKDGSVYPVEVQMQYFSDEEPPVYAAIVQDVSMKEDLMKKKLSIKRAQDLQRSLNTAVIKPLKGVALQPFFMPSEDLSGDFFSINFDNNKLVILFADCTGHGIEAAMEATLMKSLCDKYLERLTAASATHKFLESINLEVMKYFKEDKFPTLFCAVIDLDRMLMAYSNANAELPVILRGGAAQRLPKVKGFLLGFSDDVEYEIKFHKLNEGDVLFFYSDALVEIPGRDDVLINADDVTSMVQEFGLGPKRDIEAVLQKLSDMGVGFPLKDDLTMMALQILNDSQAHYGLKGLQDLPEVLSDIDNKLRQYSYTDEESAKVRLSLAAMLDSAFETVTPSTSEKKVDIDARYSTQGLEFHLELKGARWSDERSEAREEDELNGLLAEAAEGRVVEAAQSYGLSLAKSFMDYCYLGADKRSLTITRAKDNTKSDFQFIENVANGMEALDE